jgi:8-oxo-dGTP pyrophosphatase MutT (NUDIX family)
MPDPLLSGTSRLSVNDAAAAIIVVDQGGYLLQLRDSRPDIWYPAHWGLFGGGVEPGEEPDAALARELREELELELEGAEFFARIDFDLGGLELERYYRSYYVVHITGETAARLVLHEGAAMRVVPGPEALTQLRLTPYDAFALFLHHAQARLKPCGAGPG